MKTVNINDRLMKIRAGLKALSLDGIVLTQNPNIYYCTGFTGSDSWAIITSRNAYLVTDSRYTEQAKKQCPVAKVIVRSDLISKTTAEILNRQKSIKTVAIENKTPFNIYADLRKRLKTRVKPGKYIIEKIRQTKDTEEARCISQAGKIAMQALAETLKQIKPGITETQAAALLDYSIHKRGCGNGFETIVAFGANGSQPHYQPSDKKLKKNDIILIDFGASYKGYTCDITRCFTIGKASRQYLHAYKTVYLAQQAAIKTIKPGITVADVEKAARDVIGQTDFPQYGHGTGHGLGLEVHELPVVSQKIKNQKLYPGHIITIEPGIYIPGKLGIRIEDDILVTENGFRKLIPDDFNISEKPFTLRS